MLQVVIGKRSRQEASKLAGDIFGRILNRNADVAGFAYVFDCLRDGTKTLQQLIVHFIGSDEYYERFARGRAPKDIADHVTRLLLGRSIRESDLQAAECLLVRAGLREFARRIIASPEYLHTVGLDRVPPFGHEFADSDLWQPDLRINDNEDYHAYE